MHITCKNCSQIFKGHYCNNCGQTADTNRLDFHYLRHQFKHGLLHFDDGILYSGIELFTRPGHSIREFIEGKRIKHFQPISLVIVLATLYGFLYHYFHIVLIDNSTKSDNESKIDFLQFNDWIGTHYAWVTLLTIPLYTIGTSIAFRKQRYNEEEYFILNCYNASQRLFLHIANFPILYHYYSTPNMKTVSLIFYIIDVFFIYWTNEQFFNKLSLIKTFFLTLLSQFIFIISLIFTVYLVVLIFENI